MELGKIIERSLTMDKQTFNRSLLKRDHPDNNANETRFEMVKIIINRYQMTIIGL